ncbi:hypothetical protein [Thiomonas intermedia]|uniref:hypothetical protein n=1 Tax=Thiomonas intermedia TaxID=926 RepID=UPI0009A4E654|nr:hypothetical protein [Thiomonas intermedia]
MNSEMLYALRDVAGVPSHPIVFLLLGVLTFALHIAAVQVMLGATALVLANAFSRNPMRRRLAAAMTTTAKIAVSVAVVLGVAPLLFVQVTYDPFWYTSNVLSAWWVIGFILLLIAAYMALYFFYSRNHHLEDPRQDARSGWSLVAALALFLVVGFIMHVLTQQMLSPEKWMAWYAPNGVIDPSGRTLHDYNLWRFGFFIALAAPVSGAWLFAYRRYLGAGQLADAAYLQWVGRLAGRMLHVGGVIALALFAGWMSTLPANIASFATSPVVLLSVALLLLTVLLPALLGPRTLNSSLGYAPFALGAVALIAVAALREVLRWTVLKGVHGYDVFTYPVHMDWYSNVLFFATFALIGGSTLAYFLAVAWKVGQTPKGQIYTPSPFIDRIGTASLWLIGVWIVQFFVVGFVVWAR